MVVKNGLTPVGVLLLKWRINVLVKTFEKETADIRRQNIELKLFNNMMTENDYNCWLNTLALFTKKRKTMKIKTDAIKRTLKIE